MPVFNPPIALSPDVFFCQVIPAVNGNPPVLANLIDDVYNGNNTNTHHDNIFKTSPQYMVMLMLRMSLLKTIQLKRLNYPLPKRLWKKTLLHKTRRRMQQRRQ
jgi:hypothetical protein